MSRKLIVAVAFLAAFAQVNGAPNGLPINQGESSKDPITVINEILFEFTTHVLQTGKVAAAIQNFNDGTPTPNYGLGRPFTFDYVKEVCSGNKSCEQFHEQITVGGFDDGKQEYTTLISGALKNDAQVIFNVTDFKYSLAVPSLVFNSTDYQRISTNLNTSVQMVYSGLELRVANSVVGLSSDFGFSQGHFNVSNVKVTLDLGEVTMKVFEVLKYENETWTELPAIEKDAAPEVMELWRETDENGETLEKRYSSFLEGKVNEILAGRSKI